MLIVLILVYIASGGTLLIQTKSQENLYVQRCFHLPVGINDQKPIWLV